MLTCGVSRQGALSLETRYDRAGRIVMRRTRYIYGEGGWEPLARVDSVGEDNAGEVFWYHTELNGLPERMTDEYGEQVWQGRFTAWGETEHESSPRGLRQNLRFQGQYFDAETGLHYNLFRYYDPVGGRFTQTDPIGLAGGLNLYAYAYAPNALTWVDPLGLQKCKENFLYRGDKRFPNEIFRDGFQPLGDSTNLLLHFKDNRSPPSNFISTSPDLEVAHNFAARDEQKGFVYAIRHQSNGIDVNKILGKNTPFPDEVEIAVPGSISHKDILGVTPVNGEGSFVGFSFINFFR